VAWDGQRPVGVISMAGRWIKLFATDAERRGQGIGWQLLDLARTWSRQRGGGGKLRFMDHPGNYLSPGLDVREAAGRAWVERHGFKLACHIPSNLLLILVPLMPTLPLAVGVLLLRFSISQMDVPTRQSYTMAVVAPDERSAAAGVTAIARSVGAAVSPALTGLLFSIPLLFNAPFFLAGGLKIIYDLLLFREFRAVKPPEENA